MIKILIAYNIQYDKPENIKYILDDQFEFEFSFSYKIPNVYNPNISPKCYFVLKSNQNQSFDQFRSALWRFQTMLSFLVLHRARITSLTVYSNDNVQKSGNDKTVIKEISIFYIQLSKDFQEAHFHDFLLTYSELSIEFEKVISSWFKMQKDINPIIHILYKHLGDLQIFTEGDFLNIVQAVEAYHRRYIQNTNILKVANKEYLSLIFNEISSKEHIKWLKNKLAYSYEPSLKERLVELFHFSKDYLIVNHNDTEILKIIKKIVNTRNYYTHYGSELFSKKATVGQMIVYTKLLKNILIVMILSSLGISEDLMRKAINNKMKFRLVGK